jgi:capsular exopolysaccharide synthesis family protein
MYKPEEIQVQRLNDGDDDIDLKKIFFKLADHWYWFLLCTIIGLLLAYMYVSYAPPIYYINAKVLVNDQQKDGGLAKQANALMDLGGLMGAQSSVDNEIEVLKTRDLIEEVVRDMKLNVTYGQKSGFISRELYKAPFKLNILNGVDTIQNTLLEITKTSGNRVRVRTEDFDKEILWNESFRIENVGLLQLVQEPGMKMTNGDYFANVSSVDERVTEFMNQLSVAASNKQVTIVDLTLSYPVQKKGEEILNALIEKYKDSNVQDKNAIADSTYTFIKQRLNVIASELGDVEDKVEKFKTRNRLADMSEQGKLLVQNTGEYEAQLAKAETQVSVLTDLENYLKDETRNKRVFPTSLLPSDMVFASLMDQYNALLAERDKTLMSVTEATPFVQNLNSQIAGMRKGILANIQSTKNTYVVTRDKLRNQLNQMQGEIAGVPQIEKNYLQLARNQQIKQELYIFLMQKAEETAISKTSNISIAKVIARPKAEVHPVSPKRKGIYALGLFAGLMLPLVVILVKGFFNSAVTSKDDIVQATRVPIVGEISHNTTADNLIVANSGRSAIAEQFRALRSNLSFYLKSKDNKVILLTSSMSGEGKSFTAINLANVLALLGKKVLLMELDLRKPGLSGKLNIKNDLGFSSYIIDDTVNVSDIIKPLPMNENLFIISSGPLPPNPIEIIMSDRTPVLIDQLKERFDYIVMDAPPVGVIADAHALVDYAQITLYLVRQKVTQKTQLSIVDQLHRSGKIKNLGIVVNDVSSKQYGFGYGYGNYGQEPERNWFEKIFKK